MSGEREILQRLVAGPVSGDALAHEAGLTRAAMWKRVQALEEAYAQHWLLESPEFSPLTYIGGTKYAVVGDPMDAAIEVTAQGGLVIETAEEREEREEIEARERELRKAEGDEGFEASRG